MNRFPSLEEAIIARNQVGALLCRKFGHAFKAEEGTTRRVCTLCSEVEAHEEPADLPEYRYFVPQNPEAVADGVIYRVGQDLQNVEMYVRLGRAEWAPAVFPSLSRLLGAHQAEHIEIPEVQEEDLHL